MLGHTVLYRSPTYGYVVPAIVNGTEESLALAFKGTEHVPPLESGDHVHLTPIALNEHSPQRWNVPRDTGRGVQKPGTWRPLEG